LKKGIGVPTSEAFSTTFFSSTRRFLRHIITQKGSPTCGAILQAITILSFVFLFLSREKRKKEKTGHHWD